MIKLISLPTLIISLLLLAYSAAMPAKAFVGQYLLQRSWQLQVDGKPFSKPWPWADTWPVARLEVPRLGVDLFVLWGAQGNALAFGPGFETASAMPGQLGATVIGGHRDTHFNFLKDVEINTLLSLQLASGESIDYQVNDIRIVDTGQTPYIQDLNAGSDLVLVTCYPFNTLAPGGPLRYLVTARKVLKASENSPAHT